VIINQVTDQGFNPFGRVLEGIDCKELLNEMTQIPLPEGVIYEPSIASLENLSVYKVFQDAVYGELPIQMGYCIGHNYKLNAVEYHRSSEINVAVTDMILLVGRQQDITNEFTYDTKNIRGFFVPKGTVVELYATTLHYAPCNADKEGFKAVVILPKDTNLPLDLAHSNGEDQLLTAKNKWLIGHREGGLSEGSFIGLIGENITL
jgi:hypothetical protein